MRVRKLPFTLGSQTHTYTQIVERDRAMNTVRVCVRLRPFLPHELDSSNIRSSSSSSCSIVKTTSKHDVSVKAKQSERTFSFHEVFDEDADQSEVYSYVKDSVLRVSKGMNATIFAYGQTGSGKTYTMIGDEDEGRGLASRALSDLFDSIDDVSTVDTHIIRASVIEIYNNKLYDLLGSAMCVSKNRQNLHLRESRRADGTNEVYVNNLTEVRVSCAKDVEALLLRSNKAREIRETKMNARSSRSHMIMQVSVEVRHFLESDKDRTNPKRSVTKAKLTLVDLAGSEKWSENACDDQLKELTHINKSLSCLGTVVNVLASSPSPDVHVPYRDSKLTFLLRDALGGNSSTTLIATISPLRESALTTMSTLTFASRAACIQTKARVNRVVDDSELLRRANLEITRLRRLLKSRSKPRTQIRDLKKKLHTLQRSNTELRTENLKLKGMLRRESSRRPSPTRVVMDRGDVVDVTDEAYLEDVETAESSLRNILSEQMEIEARLRVLNMGLREMDGVDKVDVNDVDEKNNNDDEYEEEIFEEDEEDEITIIEDTKDATQDTTQDTTQDNNDTTQDHNNNTMRTSKTSKNKPPISSSPTPSPHLQLTFSSQDVGLEIKLFLHRWNRFVPGTILDFDPRDGGMHCVKYDLYGESSASSSPVQGGRWHNLAKHDVQVLRRSTRSRPLKTLSRRERLLRRHRRESNTLHHAISDVYSVVSPKKSSNSSKSREDTDKTLKKKEQDRSRREKLMHDLEAIVKREQSSPLVGAMSSPYSRSRV